MTTAIKPQPMDPAKVTITESHPVTNAYLEDPGQVTATVTPTAKPSVEYTSSRPRDLTSGMVRALPRYIDDITRDFGWDLYMRMILDPQVASITDVIRMGACYHGFQFVPPKDINDDDKDLASEIVDFINYNVRNLDRPIRVIAYELSAAVYLGHKVAEKIYTVEEINPDRGPQLLISGVHTKPGNATAFVTDDKNNTLGLVSTIPGKYTATTFITIGPDGGIPGLIPRDKFIVYSHEPEDGDPRGTSVLRPIYQEWWMKMQLKPVYLQFLATQAIPPVKGTLAEGAQPSPELDPITFEPTGRTTNPGTQMKTALETLQNGGVIVLPNGADASLLQGSGVNTGAVFTTAFDLFDKHIAKGISKQTLATEDTKHQSRAASQVQQDVLDMPTERVTQDLCDALREDFVRPLVLYNYGPDAARRLCPEVQSQQVDQQDFNTAASAFMSLATAGIFDPSNFEHLSWAMQVLGGPAPDEAEFNAKQAEQDKAQQAMLDAAKQPQAETKPTVSKDGTPVDGANTPGNGGPEGSPGTKARPGESQDTGKGGSAKFMAGLFRGVRRFFDPDQARDDHGRFGSGGSRDEKFAIAANVGHDSYGPKWANEYATNATQGPPLTDDQESALDSWNTNEGYTTINTALRGGGDLAPDWQSVVTDMDSSMATHTTTEDLALYRGVGAGVLPDDLSSLVGTTFEDKGFISTSVITETADKFTNMDAGARMEILAPAGTHGLYGPSLRGKDPYYEREFTLPRGTKFRVTGVGSSITKYGDSIRTLQMEVVNE